MAARKHPDNRNFSSTEKQQFVIFDCSNHFITAFCSRHEHHHGKFYRLKRLSVHALESTRARKGTKSLSLGTVIDDSVQLKEDISGEHSDVSDDEQCLNNLFRDEETRKKLELLEGMVGADSMEPGIVLAKVVAVLKDLTSRNGMLTP